MNYDQKFPVDIRSIPSTRDRAYDELNEVLDMLGHQKADGTWSKTQSTDIQVTEQCNLRCTYCFQINKSSKVLKWEDAKAYIDYLLTRTPENCSYTNPDRYHAITIGFVGGDALLEVDLIDRILTYFVERMIELDHPWITSWGAHLDTNGVLYFNEEVQRLLNKWPNALSCTITLDGNEALHDKCRVFPDGSGSYKYAVAAIEDQFKRGNEPSGKFTVAHENIDYLYDAILNMIDIGYTFILGNEVYEDVWEEGDARKYFLQLVKLADHFLEKEYYKSIKFPLLEIHRFNPTSQVAEVNTCGGNGEMLSLGADGKLYNCYRYNRTAVYPRKPLDIGDPYDGIGSTEEQRTLIKKLESITHLTCCNIDCNNCPIGAGCGYCNGCNYCVYGDPGHRTTFNCAMTCASYLASSYYWTRVAIKEGYTKRFPIVLSKDKSLQVLTEQEYKALKEYCKEV